MTETETGIEQSTSRHSYNSDWGKTRDISGEALETGSETSTIGQKQEWFRKDSACSLEANMKKIV